MPLYHYQCPKCHQEHDEFQTMANRNKVSCEACGTHMTRPISANKPFVNVWEPLTLTHIADKPMTFNSRKDLVRYCKENKVSSGALL